MEITWLGGACFRLQGSEAALATNPHTAGISQRSARPKADVVALSEDSSLNVAGELVCPHQTGREPFVVSGPGEYEVAGIYVHGIAENPGTAETSSTLFAIDIDRVCVGYMAGLYKEPSDNLLDALGAIHVLLINVDGYSNSATREVTLKTINRIEPNLVVPFGTAGDGTGGAIESWHSIAQELSGTDIQSHTSLVAIRTKLPDPITVQVLEPRGR